MNKVKRYDADGCESKCGAYVPSEDYDLLLAEHDSLKQQVVDLAVENAALQSNIKELELTVSKWEDCKHDGATWYDYSGREKCGCCGADV